MLLTPLQHHEQRAEIFRSVGKILAEFSTITDRAKLHLVIDADRPDDHAVIRIATMDGTIVAEHKTAGVTADGYLLFERDGKILQPTDYILSLMPDDRRPKFQAGQLVITSGVEALDMRDKVLSLFERHMRGDWGDWGDICEEDRELNEVALKSGGRLMSVYNLGDVTIWIITEADRSVTTALLPDEY